METGVEPVRGGRIPYLSSPLQLLSISGYRTCKHELPALAAGKHQPPINHPGGNHLSTVERGG